MAKKTALRGQPDENTNKDKKPENRKVKMTKLLLRESLMDILRQKAISVITIKEICDRADISRSTFYAYYDSPIDMFRKIEDEFLVFVQRTLEQYDFKNKKDEALAMFNDILKFITENVNTVRVLLGENGDIGFQKALITLLHEKDVLNFNTKKEIESNVRDYFFSFAISGSIGLIQHWLKNNRDRSPEEVAMMLLRLNHMA
jgi:AcrR family transcriptional regulator